MPIIVSLVIGGRYGSYDYTAQRITKVGSFGSHLRCHSGEKLLRL